MIYGKPCGSPSKSNELFVKICWLRQVALLWFALLHGEGGMQRRYAQSQPVFMDPQHLQFARSVTWSSITAALPGVRPFPFHSKHFLSLCGLFLIIYDQVDYRIRPRSNSVFSPVSSCLDNVLKPRLWRCLGVIGSSSYYAKESSHGMDLIGRYGSSPLRQSQTRSIVRFILVPGVLQESSCARRLRFRLELDWS